MLCFTYVTLLQTCWTLFVCAKVSSLLDVSIREYWEYIVTERVCSDHAFCDTLVVVFLENRHLSKVSSICHLYLFINKIDISIFDHNPFIS